MSTWVKLQAQIIQTKGRFGHQATTLYIPMYLTISDKHNHRSVLECQLVLLHMRNPSYNVPMWYGLTIYHTMYYIFWVGMAKAYIPGN
jgi:hypothetical protein